MSHVKVDKQTRTQEQTLLTNIFLAQRERIRIQRKPVTRPVKLFRKWNHTCYTKTSVMHSRLAKTPTHVMCFFYVQRVRITRLNRTTHTSCPTHSGLWWVRSMEAARFNPRFPTINMISLCPKQSEGYGMSCFKCCGSGSASTGSTYFWASWTRIHQSEVCIRIRIWILLSPSKKSKKNLDSYCFMTSFWLFIFENNVHVPSKSNKQKNFFKN